MKVSIHFLIFCVSFVYGIMSVIAQNSTGFSLNPDWDLTWRTIVVSTLIGFSGYGISKAIFRDYPRCEKQE